MKCLRVLAVVLLLLLTGIVLGVDVKTDYDKSYDFSHLRTFAFKEQRRPSESYLVHNTIVDKRIRNALIKELEAQGFQYRPDGPADFLVAYYARQKEKVDLESLDYGMPRLWRFGWGPLLWTHYYTEGSLVVDFLDPLTNQLIWRGRATTVVSGLDPSEKQINEAVHALIKHLEKDIHKARKDR
jgi:hypothetical protein